MTIETSKRHLMELKIKRYDGMLKRDGIDTFVVYEVGNQQVALGAKVAGMLLADPKQTPILLEEKQSQGVGTGSFSVNNSMYNDSPWLLYPASDSAIKFRPQLYIAVINSGEVKSLKQPRSLHEAARLFHPETNPYAIDQQIMEMATDLDHSGWQYLDDLRKNFEHLPLSTFESWLSLSKTPATLAVSILRLEIDEAFSDRMRDELAIIWESIPLSDWSNAYKNFNLWLIESGLPDHFREEMLDNRREVLKSIVSGFEEMLGYFETGDVDKLASFPPEVVLPGWYDQLEAINETAVWPKELKEELSNWVDQQDLPRLVRGLSTVTEHDAVVYLPIFMAYVTSGKVLLHDISSQIPLPILKFYIRKISDFDKASWYNSTHALLTSYLLSNKNHKD